MDKLKVKGIGKSEYHNYIIVENTESSLKYLILLIQDLGFKSTESAKLLSLLGNTDNNYAAKSYSKDDYSDKYFHLTNIAHHIDIFFGRERIVFSVISSIESQKIFSAALIKYC